MEKLELNIPVLQPEEKVLGIAYLTPDEEILFTPHHDAIEVVLVEAQPGSTGPWAVRLRSPERTTTAHPPKEPEGTHR